MQNISFGSSILCCRNQGGASDLKRLHLFSLSAEAHYLSQQGAQEIHSSFHANAWACWYWRKEAANQPRIPVQEAASASELGLACSKYIGMKETMVGIVQKRLQYFERKFLSANEIFPEMFCLLFNYY